MKNLFLFILASIFLLTASLIYAQQYEDVVYLKNGSIIHGTIIEQIPNESLKIKTKDGNVFVYKTEEISKITKEELTSVEKKEPSSKSSINRLWLGFLVGLNFSNISISSPSQTESGPDAVIMLMAGGFGERSWNKNFSTQVGISYVRKGADRIDILGYYPCSATADYLDIDILLKGKLGMQGFNPYGLFGFFIGIKLSASAEYEGESLDWSSHLNDPNLGLYIGAGTDISVSKNSEAFVEFRYELGMQNLNKDVGPSNVTSQGFKLIAGLKFGL
jgi:hypothetical protein